MPVQLQVLPVLQVPRLVPVLVPFLVMVLVQERAGGQAAQPLPLLLELRDQLLLALAPARTGSNRRHNRNKVNQAACCMDAC